MVKGDCKEVCVKHYLIIGRMKQNEKTEKFKHRNKIFKMRIFAKSAIHAKSKFWYYLRKMNKVKKSNGEVLAVHEIQEKKPNKIKTFGIVISYQSKFGHHSLYKEFRSTSLNGAVSQMCKLKDNNMNNFYLLLLLFCSIHYDCL